MTRLVHLGLGAFFRAHQAWYTERANAAGPQRWGIHAFTGRSPAAARALTAQGGRYTLIERTADGDRLSTVSCIDRAHDGADATAWRAAVSDPATAVLTLTITEAGYLDPPDADLARLRSGRLPRAAAARIVDGLRARRASSGAPLAVVSCDNLPDNGRVTRSAVLGTAHLVDPGLATWIETTVSFVSTAVDRITPATTAQDVAMVRGTFDDAVPVVTEPYTEWVLSGEFPAGRPGWEAGGARFVDDLAPHGQRKLWLLNGGHSLLAYAGLPLGCATVDEAVVHPRVRPLLEQLWREAAVVLAFPPPVVDEALAALRTRFANPRIRHGLAQIAADGSHKLTPRVLDVHRARRRAGLPVGTAGAAVLAAWARHLLGDPALVSDPAADGLAVQLRRAPEVAAPLLARLAPDLVADRGLLAAVDAAFRDSAAPHPAR